MFVRSKQYTISNKISCSGISLHSGMTCCLTLYPAPPDSGITFYQNIPGRDQVVIPASYKNVVNSILSTTIGNTAGDSIGTIEHLMAALYGCGVDNVNVEIDGPEIPIMDGSAAPFVSLLESAGIIEQQKQRKVIKVTKSIAVSEGDAFLRIDPIDTDDLRINFFIDYDNPIIDSQKITFSIKNQDFKSEICNARTYGFESEVKSLRESGLALGGSLDNAVVISGDNILNQDGLRYRDEFVRHKVLDLIGDLYLADFRIVGEVFAEKSGHNLNKLLLDNLHNQKDAYVVDQTDGTFRDWSEVLVAASA